MMVSLSTYRESIKNKTYKELIQEREKLLKEIKSFESNTNVTNDLECMDPSPEVFYQCNLMYLSELCNLLADKYNEEFIDVYDKKFTYVFVKFDYISEKLYCYRTTNPKIEIGARVLVDRAGLESLATVIDVNTFSYSEVPYPIEKTKKIISIIDNTPYERLEFPEKDILINYKLLSDYLELFWEITILDRSENNLIINDDRNKRNYIFTVSNDDVNDLKNVLLQNKKILKVKSLPSQRIFDGTIHEFFFRIGNDIKKIGADNLPDYKNMIVKSQSIKLVFKIIYGIDKILSKYKVHIVLE